MYKNNFAERLKKARNDIGYSQKQVEEEIGIKQSTISKYENGELEPNLEALGKLAQLYNVSLNWLLGVVIEKN